MFIVGYSRQRFYGFHGTALPARLYYIHYSIIDRIYAEIDSALTPSPSPAGEGRKNYNFAPLLLREKRCPELVEGGLGDEGKFYFA